MSASTPSSDHSSLTASQGQDSVTHSLVSVDLEQEHSPSHIVLGGGSTDEENRSSSQYTRLREEPETTGQTAPVPAEGRYRRICFAVTRGVTCALLLCISVCMIVVGLVYRHQCPIHQDIPVFLTAEGVALTLRLCLLCWQYAFKDRSEENGRLRGTVLNKTAHFLEMTTFILLVIGSMKVYAVFGRVQFDDPSKRDEFCQLVLYWFAFYFTTILYIIVLSSVLFILFYTTRCF